MGSAIYLDSLHTDSFIRLIGQARGQRHTIIRGSLQVAPVRTVDDFDHRHRIGARPVNRGISNGIAGLQVFNLSLIHI